jgi:Asp-tRNA(Asn)/Glu-tRNA(Gln) amidotransferase B subunit
VCKSAHDIILQPEILEKEIGEADFYYLNGIGYGGMEKYNFDNNRIINEDFYPQTNFYFINKDKIDYLNNIEYCIKTYKQLINTPGFNGKPWEYIPNWSCEYFLKQCVERNKLLKEHLISQDSYLKLIEIVKQFQIHDNSHKNIMIDGICHFHNQNDQIIEI